MATPEEMRRMREFFGPQTYGDQDPDAMPDMFNEIDPTSESYLGVPVDEFGEKTNPTGRSMDRALRRFFGGGEDFDEDSLSRADAEFEADTLGEISDEVIDEMGEGDDLDPNAMIRNRIANSEIPNISTAEDMVGLDEEAANADPDAYFPDMEKGMYGEEASMNPQDIDAPITDVSELMSAVASLLNPARKFKAATTIAKKLLPGSVVPRQLTGTAQRQISSPNPQITAGRVLPRNVRPPRNPTGGNLLFPYLNELQRSGMRNAELMNRGFQGKNMTVPELQRQAFGRGEFGMGGRQGGQLPQFLQRFFE
jgi:hypothetical protein